jgi:hypothetical protein
VDHQRFRGRTSPPVPQTGALTNRAALRSAGKSGLWQASRLLFAGLDGRAGVGP